MLLDRIGAVEGIREWSPMRRHFFSATIGFLGAGTVVAFPNMVTYMAVAALIPAEIVSYSRLAKDNSIFSGDAYKNLGSWAAGVTAGLALAMSAQTNPTTLNDVYGVDRVSHHTVVDGQTPSLRY